MTGKKAFRLLSDSVASLLCGILNSLICSALSSWIAALFGYLLRDGCFAVLIVQSWQRGPEQTVFNVPHWPWVTLRVCKHLQCLALAALVACKA